MKQKRFLWIVGVIVVLCITIVPAILNSERYGVWHQGLQYMVYESHDYLKSSSLDENSYTIEIDLNDLDSNAGKRIYDNDDCYIEIDGMDCNSVKQGGYRIFFRSHGVCDYVEGKLVSGIFYRGGATELSAALQTTYNGIVYHSSSCGYGPLGDDNSDTFGFYLFPTEVYENGAIPMENAGTVMVTLTNLREHELRRGGNFDFLTRYIN